MIHKEKNLDKISLFNTFLLPIIKIVGPIFFDKKYLRGRHFDKNSVGWTWVLRGIIWQKIFGFNRHIPWPVSPFIMISNPNNIQFDVDNLDNFNLSFGNYFQNFNGSIIIGKGTFIAPNVGIITANHDPNNLECYLPANNVIIGQNCWIGMNSVILPGVHLGDHTIVGAGSVITRSFFEGNCIIAGNPAKIIKIIEKEGKNDIKSQSH